MSGFEVLSQRRDGRRLLCTSKALPTQPSASYPWTPVARALKPPARESPDAVLHGSDTPHRVPAVEIPTGMRAVIHVTVDRPNAAPSTLARALDSALLTIEVAHDAQVGDVAPERCRVLLEAGRDELCIVLPGTAAPQGWIVTVETDAGPVTVREYEIRMLLR